MRTGREILPLSLPPRGLSRPVQWPRLMRAETAAAYVDERSVRAFLRSCGSVYPLPQRIAGKGNRWLKDHLDQAINRLFTSAETIQDIAGLV